MTETIIRRVARTEGILLASVRLRALETDPDSFGSTYEREAAFEDAVWGERAGRSAAGDEIATFIAIRDAQAVGIVTASREREDGQTFVVTGMWVAPDARRAGVGLRLLTEAERWIASCGGAHVRLSVASTATAARHLYEAAGYGTEREDGGSAADAFGIGLHKGLG